MPEVADDTAAKRQKTVKDEVQEINGWKINFSKKLGAGSYGQVFEAERSNGAGNTSGGSVASTSERESRHHAAKVIDDTPRNRREAQILRSLWHINVVQLVDTIDLQQLGKKILLVMPRADCTLAGFMSTGCMKHSYCVWECAVQLVCAVEYLHSRSTPVMHRPCGHARP